MSKYSHVINCLQEKLTHFNLAVSVEYVISSLYVLNCFEYFLINILGQMSQKDQARNVFWTISILHAWFSVSKWLDIHKDFWTISSLCVSKWLDIYKGICTISSLCVTKFFNTLKLYTHQKHYSVKIGSISFFLTFWHAKIPPCSRMPRYDH